MKLEVVGASRARGLAPRLRALASELGRELGRRRDSLTLLLTDDAGIRKLNRRFLGKDRATDVLSFPSGEDAGYLGDLAISIDTARRQAAQMGHDLAAEAEVLLLHGVLHLLGHDHETDGGRMRRLESRIARRLLGGSGLIHRTRPASASAGASRPPGRKRRPGSPALRVRR